ncbi:uncharacterized protein LOC127690775 [Apodemus sylvaticus]|uniref:uncharacterized protein LOC127690775 n=1 Tax=Apodemus sylvaticus TaxID=10129 RepID=UPI0022442DD2|nr:uncharacterized protein LOC127690775 [Apodemus sylvaticus]
MGTALEMDNTLLCSEAGMLSMLRRLFRRGNRIQTETRPRQKRQKEAGLLSCWETRRKKWSWGRHNESWKAPSQLSTINEEEQRMKRLDKLKRDLQKMENERDELRGILAHYTNKDLNDRNNFEKFMLTMQYYQMMTGLKKMPQKVSEALSKSEELTKENPSYWIRNRQLLCDSNHQKHKVKMLWTDNRELLQEQIALEEDTKHTNILCIKACEVLNDSGTKREASGRMNEHQGQVALFSKHKHSEAHVTILNLIQFMGSFAICPTPSHRKNFETFMLNMQYQQKMTDLKKMPQELSVALSKYKELSKENHSYWSEIFQLKLKRGSDHVKISLRHNSSPGALSVESK